MKGAQTEPVRIEPYTTAVTLVLRLAGRVFACATRPTAGIDKELYQHYSNLRDAAQKMLDTRDTVLGQQTQARVLLALKAAHDLAHDMDCAPQPPLSECPCDTADTIRILTLKLLRQESLCSR